MKTLERPKEVFPVSLPDYKLWTVEECDRLRELGFLPDRYELIEGVVVGKMGQTSLHAGLICALVNILGVLFGYERVRVQLPIRILGALGRYNEPLPDIAVTRKTYRAYYKQTPLSEDLLLVVEVSDSTLRSDLSAKALVYSRAGVAEYWVLDVTKERLVAHRFPTTDGYEDITEWKAGERIAPLARPEEFVSLEELFSQEVGEEAENEA